MDVIDTRSVAATQDVRGVVRQVVRITAWLAPLAWMWGVAIAPLSPPRRP